jgi:autotransporter-associated beta strand protein
MWARGQVANGAAAVFGDTTDGNAVSVTLDSSRAVAALTFNTATEGGSYTISRGSGDTTSTLTLARYWPCNDVSVTITGGGSHTIAVPITLTDSVYFTGDVGSVLTISGNVSGQGGVTLTAGNVGTLVLAGSNSYTGGTTISEGTLDFAAPEAVPTTGILNVGRSGSVDLTGLLAASLSSTADTNTEQTSLADSPGDATAGLGMQGQTVAGNSDGTPLGDPGSIARSSTVSVPEPSTFVLLCVAMIGLLAGRRAWGRRDTR